MPPLLLTNLLYICFTWNEEKYLQSLENKAFQEAIFNNLTAVNFLAEVNKKKAVAFNSTEESTDEINKRIEEIEQASTFYKYHFQYKLKF
jgi:uncharacterized protein (UPF0305 family)